MQTSKGRDYYYKHAVPRAKREALRRSKQDIKSYIFMHTRQKVFNHSADRLNSASKMYAFVFLPLLILSKNV